MGGVRHQPAQPVRGQLGSMRSQGCLIGGGHVGRAGKDRACPVAINEVGDRGGKGGGGSRDRCHGMGGRKEGFSSTQVLIGDGGVREGARISDVQGGYEARDDEFRLPKVAGEKTRGGREERLGERTVSGGSRRGGRSAPEDANSLCGGASLRGRSRRVGVRRGGPRGGIKDIEGGGLRFMRRVRTRAGGLTRHWKKVGGLARTPSGNPGSEGKNGVYKGSRKSPQPKRWWWYGNKKG